MTERWITVQQAAARTAFEPEAIRRAIRRGDLVAFKPSGRLRIAEEDLEAWVRGCPARLLTAVEEVAARHPRPVRRVVAADVGGGSFVERARRDAA